ncbi:MAG TPA: DCC1-like thiol-disulfide oxidoreductase family protein [Oculatellaceae cyanobacterium]|jgi:predicted DCC family thiol-disulfide oxidoreductase YuxK
MVDVAYERPTLIYDGICPLCQSGVSWLKWLRLDEGVDALTWQDAVAQQPSLTQSGWAEKIAGEVLLVLPDGQVLGGANAAVWLLERKPRTRWVANLLGASWGLRASRWLYETVALNRRILTPPKQTQVACSCEPPENPAVRRRLYLLLLAVSLLGLVVFSYTLAAIYGRAALDIIFHLLIAMGGGWILAYIGLWLLLRERFIVAFRQSLVVMAIGGLWLLVASALLASINLVARASGAVAWTSILSLNMHTAVMFLSVLRRSAALHFPPATPWLWLLLYFGGYLFLIGRFF